MKNTLTPFFITFVIGFIFGMLFIGARRDQVPNIESCNKACSPYQVQHCALFAAQCVSPNEGEIVLVHVKEKE